MFATVKQFFIKHFSALNDETTALNERQAITSGIKGFLLLLFRLTIIIGVCYVIMGPVFGIVANSFFSNKDAYNPMVYLIPQNPTLERYQLAIKIMDYLPVLLRQLRLDKFLNPDRLPEFHANNILVSNDKLLLALAVFGQIGRAGILFRGVLERNFFRFPYIFFNLLCFAKLSFGDKTYRQPIPDVFKPDIIPLRSVRIRKRVRIFCIMAAIRK